MSNVYPLDIEPTVRLPKPAPYQGADIIVTTGGEEAQTFDAGTGTTQIELPDGVVQVSFGPPKAAKKETQDFGDNLAEELSDSELSAIAEKLLLGIQQDEQSRAAWLENMSSGISLLGLEVKTPRGASVAGATPAEGVSTVDHPLLLEAVLRFQANARGELLPTDGPVKVRNDGEGNELAGMLADALEKDMNHYLTKVAKEYYPDTDRMLLMLGFSGIAFKKGYHHPIKRRPVIESIPAKDLIVSNAATDLEGSGRVTHSLKMRPSVLKRMQLVGAFRNVHLAAPGTPEVQNPVDAKIGQVQGIAPPTYLEQDDQDRELYECYCELDIPGFEHQFKDETSKEMKETGLPLPYKVTLDRESRTILEIRRNWEEEDVFCMPRNRIIAYVFIPGFGFYGIGLLNVLGNATKAVTAAWRLMIDAGMFSNFPGFLYLKNLGKQLTNQFRIPPGGGQAIDTIGQDIRSAVMPLPYKDPSAVFIQLIENIATTAQRVGGTAELQVGEGKQDAPVGTVLAMIEQATKLMSAVHKRLHQAQGQEFDMLKSLLMEDPEALWRHNKKSKVLALLSAQAGLQPVTDAQEKAEDRHRKLFLAALQDCELVPAADPNTSSQTERYLKVVAARQMAASNPSIDMNAVDQRAFQVMGWDDAASLFKPPPPPGAAPPTPESIAAQATLLAAQARLMDSQTKQREAGIKAQNALQDANVQQQELQSKEKIASLGVARELVIHNSDRQMAEKELAMNFADSHANRVHEAQQSAADRQHDLAKATLGHVAGHASNVVKLQHSTFNQGLSHMHDARQAAADRNMQLLHLAQKPPQGVAPGEGNQ